MVERMKVTVGRIRKPKLLHDFISRIGNRFDNSLSTGRAALLFGLKAPTGVTDETSRGGERLEIELQPGSGSWDTFLGLAYSRNLGNWSLDTNILYTFVMEGAQDTDLGNIFNYNLALSYPLSGDSHQHHTHDHLHSGFTSVFVFELNGEWRDHVEINGLTESNSGGNLFYLSPGLVMNVNKWSLGLSVAIPITNLNGIQSEPETRLIAQLGFVF